MFNIKNEKNNFHRILTGIVDIYTFYIKKRETAMCSCVNDWNYFNKIRFYTRQVLEKIIFYIIYFIFVINKYVINEYIINKYKKNIIYKIVSKIVNDIFIIIINNYCI